jgi:hypothetical protein
LSEITTLGPKELKARDIDPLAWNRVVIDSGGYFTQLYEWMEICCDTFNYEAYPLFKEEDGRLTSICPMIFDPTSKELQSPPLTGLGGPLPESELSSYLSEIEKLSNRLGADRVTLQVRSDPIVLDTLKGFGYNTGHMIPYYVLDLEGIESYAKVRQRFSHGAKRGENISKRSGIEVTTVAASQESLTASYDIYQQTMTHNKAQNIMPKELFTAIGTLFTDHTVIFNAERNNKIGTLFTDHTLVFNAQRDDGKLVGTAICFIVGERLKTWYITGLIEERKARVNNALYTAIVRYSLSNGIRFVDYGPSGVFSNAHEMKTGHGGTPVWITNAVKIRNPLKRSIYSFKKRLRKRAIEMPDSQFSRLYKKYIAKSG